MTIVLATSAVLGFVLQITAYEQKDRKRDTLIGSVGGLLVGSLAAAQQNGDLKVAFLGLGGAGAGAMIGWFVAFLISLRAQPLSRTRFALLFLNLGPAGVDQYITEQERDAERKQLEQDVERKRYAMQAWTARYGRMVRQSWNELESKANLDDVTIEALVRLWLRGLADTFNYLMLDPVAPTSDRYHLRASLIFFKPGDRSTGDRSTGEHWIKYSGRAEPHSKKEFTEESVAYKVASEDLPSPTRVSSPPTEDVPPALGESRGAVSYRAYSVARVSACLVLTIDWEIDTISNEYLDLLESVVDAHLADAIGLVMRCHSRFKGSLLATAQTEN
jgi:hypothetical protein